LTPGAAASGGPHPRGRRRPLAAALLALATWGALEALAQAALVAFACLRGLEAPVAARFSLHPTPRSRIPRILAGGELYYPLDPDLGWTVAPGGRARRYRANSQGIRADADYAPTPPPGVLRIAAFGDSFVHGTEVGNEDTWPARLAALRPGLEVLNFGVGAYGVDQSYLRYLRDGVGFEPHVVVIGFMTENVHRSVNDFRPFYAPRLFEPRSKPRFVLREGELVLLPNPLRTREDYRALLENEPEVIERLGRDDYYYATLWRETPFSFLPSVRLARFLRSAWSRTRTIADGRYNPRSEAFEVTARVLEAFYDAALERGSLPVVLVLPERSDFERRRDGEGAVYGPLLERLAAGGIASLDGLACFEPPGRRRAIVFMGGGHYAPAMNAALADCLLERFDRRGWLSRQDLPRALAAARAARRATPPR
jgi:hypothetical protein